MDEKDRERALKLLRLAFDPAAKEAEAEVSITMFLRFCRVRKLNYEAAVALFVNPQTNRRQQAQQAYQQRPPQQQGPPPGPPRYSDYIRQQRQQQGPPYPPGFGGPTDYANYKKQQDEFYATMKAQMRAQEEWAKQNRQAGSQSRNNEQEDRYRRVMEEEFKKQFGGKR